MSRLQIVHSLARLQCTRCGAEANASCNCGEPYVPAAIRVAEYDKKNPGKSTRAAAADLGVSNATVSKARGVNQLTPETVTGDDGKTYPAKRTPRPIPAKSDSLVVTDFEKLKKQVAELAEPFKSLTPSQAREIVKLIDPMIDSMNQAISDDNDRKRLIKEAKNPDKALEDSRELEQRYGGMDDDRAEAKKEARANGEDWSDIKDEWEAQWLADNWDEKREKEFLDEFKNRWKTDHGQEFPKSDHAPANK